MSEHFPWQRTPSRWSRSGLVILAAIAFALATRTSAAQTVLEDEFRLVDGDSFRGRVLALDEDWSFVVEDVEGQTRTLQRDSLVLWGRHRETTAPLAMLADGGEVAGDLIAWTSEKVTFGNDYENFSLRSVWEPSLIPVDALRGVLLQEPGGAKSRDALTAWTTSPDAKTGRLKLLNEDVVTGAILGLRAKAAGPPAGDVRDEPPARTLRVQSRGRELEIPLAQVRVATINPGLIRSRISREPSVLLAFRDGSLVNAQSFKKEDEIVRVTTVGGVVLTARYDNLLRQLTMIQPLGGPRVVYLSDLKSLGYRHISFLGQAWPAWGVDANLRDGRLRVGGNRYAKGAAMHSASRIAFALPEQSARLEAELAIDDVARGHGSVVFRVYADRGEGKFESLYASPTVRAGVKPIRLELDVSGAKRVALLVDFADRGDTGDHADWLNLRVIKQADKD